jgi:uncharacterized protein YecA (UPF0149 family)
MSKEQEREELHRAIWQIANEQRASLDEIIINLEA